ncbi:MAG: phospholipase [Chloroflexi bacterium]|nr:phospholipase [Chloroflexota bacterium]
MSARVALVLVIALAMVAAIAIFLPRVGTRTAATAARGGWYEIYFTEPRYPDRPENHRGGIDEKLVALIDATRTTLDVAIYDFDLENVAAAMARAKGRGVRVRLVTDSDTLGHKDETVQRALRTVGGAGIPIVADERRAIMHHKFAVFDGEVVLTGSWNFTAGDTYRLNNNAVVFKVRELAENYTAEFEKMFELRRFGPAKPEGVPNRRIRVGDAQIETYFAPAIDPSPRLVELVGDARFTIDFLAFSFTHDAIGKAVVDQAKAGAKVRGVFETTGSETRFSEYGRMKQSGLEVYQDGNPYVMHHKVLVVDGRTTVFGSYNFSDNASQSNDENVLVVHSPEFARAFLAEVERVVARAQRPARR